MLFNIWHTRVMDYEKYPAAAKPGVADTWTQEKDGVPVGQGVAAAEKRGRRPG